MTTESTTERFVARRNITVPPATVFALLTDPAKHRRTEPGDWVRDAIDPQPLTHVGQVFGMNMFAEAVDVTYETYNRVTELVPDTTIAWAPGDRAADGTITEGGHFWRYDLAPGPDGSTDVTLTYDWSGMSPESRAAVPIGMPPFPEAYLDESLAALDIALTGEFDDE